jgi:glucose-6-phosphate dehydrogenase assembly protein OpcA
MNPTDELETFERGGAIEVPVARIEDELAALWRQAAQQANATGRKPVTRASLWNLIVRVDSEPLFVEAKRLIDEISAQVPARVIVLHVQNGGADLPLRAWVEANWRTSDHGESGSDEITLAAGGPSGARLPSLVRALCVTDLPRALLWWSSSLGEKGPTRDLLGEIDRLIIDTRKLPSDAGLAEYVEVMDAHPDVDLVDCAWLAARPLRGLCASMFDPPRDTGRLQALTRVRVIAGVSGCPSGALLTLGWLSSRLGWHGHRKIDGGPGFRKWRSERPGGEVTLELEIRPGGPAHGVIGLELEADAGEEWTLTRDQTCISVEGVKCVPRVQPHRQHSDADLVISALGPRGRDPIFKESLREAVRLVEVRP